MVTLGLFSLMGIYDRNTNPASVTRTTLDMVQLAEDMGFDTAWFSEHHFTNHSICPHALMMVAAAAQVTSRIKLGPGVTATAFHNPLRLVQEVAFADVLTEGRLVLGLGTGYQPFEFSTYNIDPARKYRRLMETWDILEQGLKTGFIDYQGEEFQVPEIQLPMRAAAAALPEIFVASRRPEVIERAARGGHTPFISFGHHGVDHVRPQVEALRAIWRRTDGALPEMPLAVQRYVYVTDSADDARHAAECVRNLTRANMSLATGEFARDGAFLRLMPFHDEPPLNNFLDKAVIGSAEHCAARLSEEMRAIGTTHLSCFMGFAGIGRRETLASLERFGTDVIPLLERDLPLRRAEAAA